MTAIALLSAEQRAALAHQLPLWTQQDARGGVLLRTFVFADFAQAFQFMTAVAAEAERLDHHPEWRNVYHRVEVLLTTHDAGGLTTRDVALAQAMDRIAGAISRQGGNVA